VEPCCSRVPLYISMRREQGYESKQDGKKCEIRKQIKVK
jgi:hypothetical protein